MTKELKLSRQELNRLTRMSDNDDQELKLALRVVLDRASSYESRKDSDGAATLVVKFKPVREYNLDQMVRFGPVMTVADLAAFLHVDSATVRRMCGARAQRSSLHPLPFIKLNEKGIRFRRDEVIEWVNTYPHAV